MIKFSSDHWQVVFVQPSVRRVILREHTPSFFLGFRDLKVFIVKHGFTKNSVPSWRSNKFIPLLAQWIFSIQTSSSEWSKHHDRWAATWSNAESSTNENADWSAWYCQTELLLVYILDLNPLFWTFPDCCWHLFKSIVITDFIPTQSSVFIETFIL